LPSQVLTYQSNLNQVSGALASTRIAVAGAVRVLETTESALKALKKIDTDADALGKIAEGLELALKLVSKLGRAGRVHHYCPEKGHQTGRSPRRGC